MLARRRLGHTDIEVSRLCLGTMTWGSQNDYTEAASQIDRALEAGVNFLDTAEMYPTTPLSEETCGDTESIIGQWLANGGQRDAIVLATKVTGNGRAWVRDGGGISGATMREAVEGSLRRLRTDYIDLYQLHWPNRGSYHFRQNWAFDPTGQSTEAVHAHVHDVLRTADDLVREGKIRSLGLSNESAWGTMRFLNAADAAGLPRVVSIQNEYSLLCRHFDLDLAEVAHHEQVGLLAFSPLAAGMLTGKYDGGAVPPGSRRAQNEMLGGRFGQRSRAACGCYVTLAREHGLDPAQMALGFCLTRPFMASVIIGATSMVQLETNLAAASLELSAEVLDGIDTIHRSHGTPM